MSNKTGSFNTANFTSLRIAGAPTYVPAHINASGKMVQSMCTFGAFQNLNGRPHRFRFTAWGGMADVVAKACATGKKVSVAARIESYMGKVIQQDAQGNAHYVQNGQGAPLEVEKTGFVVEDISLGEDSQKTIDAEIQAGQRGQYWNVPGTQDALNWAEERKRRNSLQFNAQSPTFGFANVRIPNGQIVDPKAYKAAQNGNVGTGTAQFAGNPQAVGNVMNPNPQMAPQGQVGNGAPPVQANVHAPAATPGQPVMVHGQNMGYPIQNQAAAPAQPQMPAAQGTPQVYV